MKLIGVAGTNGAGKDSVGEILAKEHGYMFISVTNLLRAECTKRSLPIEREHLRAISGEWRREGGLGVLVDKAVELYRQSYENYQGLVMASMRNDGEADRIHELGGTMIWVDADSKVRYNRIYSRQRTTEDNKTYEQFLSEEKDEMFGNPNDPTSLNMAVVKEKSDLIMLNEGNDIATFANDLAASLRSLNLL